MVGVTACIPTRGNVDMEPILRSLPEHWHVIVWDNSEHELDLAVYARYVAIEQAPTAVVYTQDDDCVLAPDSLDMLERRYQEGVLTTNMPVPFRQHYSDSCLVGFGAIFDRWLPGNAFGKLGAQPPDHFGLTCDVYFTALTESFQLLDLPYENLPWATGPDRMYRQSNHVGIRADALEHARSLR